MLDAASAFEATLMQRARGKVRVAAKLRAGKTVLDRLYQSGSGKARIPKGDGFEVVLLNTAGGVTGGDRFETKVEVASGTTTTLTTQTAERIYRSSGENGEISTSIQIAENARVDWLPQETILFDGGRLKRRLNVDMASDATFLAIEPLVLGRAAMGETVTEGLLSDHWRIHREGKLVYADALRLDGEISKTRERSGTLDGSLACASLVYCAPEAEDRIDLVRKALRDDGGASAWNGLLAARLVAKDGATLRAALVRTVAALRSGPLPRVWFT